MFLGGVMYPGARVVWAGVQNEHCAPGFNGTVLRVSAKDADSVKVRWDERDGYTWERRKNLRHVSDGAGQVGEPFEGPPRTPLEPASTSSPAP